MTAFILAVIVNSYSTGQVGGAVRPPPSPSHWPRGPGLSWDSRPSGEGLHQPGDTTGEWGLLLCLACVHRVN